MLVTSINDADILGKYRGRERGTKKKGNREKTRQTKLFDQSAATRKCGVAASLVVLFFIVLLRTVPRIPPHPSRLLSVTFSVTFHFGRHLWQLCLGSRLSATWGRILHKHFAMCNGLYAYFQGLFCFLSLLQQR